MKLSRRTGSNSTALPLLLLSCLSFAHSDLEKPVFVAADGVDNGRCHDATSPCRTISYALTIAGKGGQIRVAEGGYPVRSTEDLFHIISGVVDIQGGFRQAEGFTQAADSVSLLMGVPAQYRSILQAKGFQIIADRKGIDGPVAAEAQQMLALHQKLKTSASAQPCVNGTTAGLDCDSVDLLSHVAFTDFSGGATSGADVWGFVDLNSNREYAFFGMDVGTAVLDVTDPEAPLEIGLALGTMAIWRDIKVHQFFNSAAGRWNAYAYVTTDGSTDGMIVIDLTKLPNEVSRTDFSSDFTRAHNVYATNTDFTTGLSLTGDVPTLIIAGSDNGTGRYRAYSLLNPAAPEFIVMPAGGSEEYMHDAASMIITDARKDTQCVNAGTYCEILFDFNETTVDLWDITIATDPQRLSRTPYPNVGYVHSGWWSEDGQYMFVHDELDERNNGLNTTLRVFALDNLLAPTLAQTWAGTTAAIDHNGFVRGSRYYMSNYSQGLTILDISDPLQPVEVGSIDTYPFSQSANFVGAWGAYPYFPSGNVAISDIDSGFYLVSDQTRNVPEGSLSFSKSYYAAVEGQQASLTVQRVNGSAGNVSVDYKILGATADGNDYQLTSGLLSWTTGDTSDRTIDLTINDDGQVENIELLMIRLISPGGGATLGSISTASLYVNDPGAQAEVRYLDTTINSSETGIGSVFLIVQRIGSGSGQVTVDYGVTGGDASIGADFSGDTSGTLTWADGDAAPKSLQILITDDIDEENTEFFELTLSNPEGATLTTSTKARVNITSNEAPLPPPPAPPVNNGGGAPAPAFLLLLGLLLLNRANRREDV